MPPLHLVTLSLLTLAPGSPTVSTLLPAGAQRGTTVKLTLAGEHLAFAQQVLLYDPGLTALKLENVSDKSVTLELAVAPDAPLGEHRLRLRTAGGLSDLRTFYVGALPVIPEAEPNSEFAAAQKVPLNSTVAGVITREDVDCFAVDCKAGDRLTAEIEAIRLGQTLFDPALAILDARRFELAVSDDSPLLAQDATASILIPADGTYTVMVREASYGGSDQSHYRLHIGALPRPRAVWPPGARPGETLQLTFPGAPLSIPPLPFIAPQTPGMTPVYSTAPSILHPRLLNAETSLPPTAFPFGNLALLQFGNLSSPSPNWLVVSDLPIAPDAPAAGEPPAPIAFHGILKKTGDAPPVNAHRFTAKAGQPLDLRVLARRLRTPLDPVLDVFDAKGAHLAGNDDAGGPAGADPELRFTPPADGVYELRIRDFRNRAGDDLVYRVEVSPPRPQLSISLDRLDPRRPQFLQAIAVPKGARFAVMMRAERKDCAGDMTLDLPGLPPGLTAKALPIPADLPAGPVLFEAAPDAPNAGALVEVHAKVGDLAGAFTQSMPLVLGPPNDTVYYQTAVDRLAVAVADPAPFRVKLEQPAAPLLRQGGRNLKVTVERDEGFKADVAVQMLWNPPGLSSTPAVTLNASQPAADYAVNVAGDAPLKTWKVAVLAHANVEGGDVWIASDFIDLTVADTYESGKLEMAAAERGKPASMICKLAAVRPFEGKAKLTLVGLPPKTACPPKEIASADAETIFEIAIDPDAPVGQHRGLFCELEIQQGPETVKHRLAFDGVLRIDNPPPPPANAPATPPPPPPPPPPAGSPPPRPLSRLEQLRKQAEEKNAPKPEAPK